MVTPIMSPVTELHISRCGVVSQLVGVYKISGLILKGVTFSVLNRKTSRNNPCKQCSKSKEGARAHIYSVIIGICIRTRVHVLYSDCDACALYTGDTSTECELYTDNTSTECELYTDDTSILDVSSIQTIRLLNVHCIQTIRLLNIRQPAGAASLRCYFGGSFPDINICSTASLVTHSTGARGEASMKGEHSGGHWRTRLTLIVLISTLLQRNNLTSAGEFGQG